MKATFFVLGERVDEHPQLFARVLDAGHDVQVHGFAHLRHPECTRAEIETDLERALECLRNVGVEPARWRIPWGHLADFTPALAAARNLELAGWTQRHARLAGRQRRTRCSRACTPTAAAIVLAHDGIGIGALPRHGARETAKLIAPLVEKARRAGLEPGPLDADWPIAIPAGNPSCHPGVGPARDRSLPSGMCSKRSRPMRPNWMPSRRSRARRSRRSRTRAR